MTQGTTKANTRLRYMTPAQVKALISGDSELAILDAREEGAFGPCHLFWAVPCPVSCMEWRARALLPSKSVRIVCVDGGEGNAETLAEYLLLIGYVDVSILVGGMPNWIAAGYIAFSGVHVPSKAFGEWVEHHYETPSIDPSELVAMVKTGRKMVILDSRPKEEFTRMSIPGGINVPGGELVYRIGDFVHDPETTIVINCAGRTRSIMGAESLRSAGIPNQVVALRNGTMGWELAGFKCAHSKTESFRIGVPREAELSLARADRFARQHGVQFIGPQQAESMKADTSRSCYVLDVRDPVEYAQGHLSGSLNAPGGQLVQSVDMWVAVRNARIILVDDTGTRARMSAGWLRQLGGWEVHVLEGALNGTLETGMPPLHCPEADAVAAPCISPRDVAALGDRVRIIDLNRSVSFRAGHAPGAIWGLRGRLARLLPKLGAAEQLVITAPELALARLAYPELAALVTVPIAILAGGMAEWKACGLPIVANRRNPEDRDCDDVHLLPFDHNDGIEEAMRAYLAWEIDLVHEVKKDGDASFGAWPN
jgi:rhodanese-related sulfurtransferase